jgi:hydrogenase maturation protein HypF
MLPSTPLHHLLLREAGLPFVMTSGNRSEEPICISNDDARERLTGIADAFLVHDREIFARYDDSVTRVWKGVPVTIRRARGQAPSAISLSAPVPPILGTVSARFLATLADAIGEMCGRVGDATGLTRACFGGGVFMNDLLLARAARLVRDDGLDVYVPRVAPAGDGGIALGQVLVGGARAEG